MCKKLILSAFLLSFSLVVISQTVTENIVREVNNNSQLEKLGIELVDKIGPRLVGSPQMKQAHDWVANTYKNWGIEAQNQQWGEWKGWERGISHIDMVYPRMQSLSGIQLAWSPQSPKKGITAEVIILPFAKDSMEFAKMATQIKGKIVMISMPQPTGRTDESWERNARKEAFEEMKTLRSKQAEEWQKRISNTGYTVRTIAQGLEKMGAAAVLSCFWSKTYGSNKIFGTNTKKIPVFDVSLEDYGMLYRLAEANSKPVVNLVATSKNLGMQPTFNTVATIPGTEKSNEYVILSAHLDSWDGATGATDNATGTLIMMEAMRLLKTYYPHPKRTIIAGHWGSEEQGLNGSRAFVKDHPEIVKNTQAVFNQDGGTGRMVFINGAGFLHSYNFLRRWINGIPENIAVEIKTDFPGTPMGGGSDNASFVAAGVPAFYLGTQNWDYGPVTWHTNLDTYDKIVFDDLKRAVIATTILAYMASEDSEKASQEKIKVVGRNGQSMPWPEVKDPIRKGGEE